MLNKNAIANAIATLLNFEKTSFDSYASWNNKYIFSEEMVKNSYNRQNKKNDYIISENDYFNLSENIKYNITNLADQNPNIDFYLFYPPYSIYYWDNANQNGVLKLQLECIEYTTKELLKHPNIHLYSFLDEYEIINDLNNYKDIRHYNEKINSLILQKDLCIENGTNKSPKLPKNSIISLEGISLLSTFLSMNSSTNSTISFLFFSFSDSFSIHS